jgi:hypothetical protein
MAFGAKRRMPFVFWRTESGQALRYISLLRDPDANALSASGIPLKVDP